MEAKKAEGLGADLKTVEEARQAALQAARGDHAEQKKKEDERQQQAAEISNQKMRDEIAKIEIERKSRDDIAQTTAAGGSGSAARVKELELERQRALLELERKTALREAKTQGLDPAIVNELYDARQAMTEQQAKQDRFAEISRGRRELSQAALAPTARMGSLEAYQAIARHGDPALRVQENQLRKLSDIDRNTQRAAEAAEDFGFAEVGIGDD
jgi:hypothetical protein